MNGATGPVTDSEPLSCSSVDLSHFNAALSAAVSVVTGVARVAATSADREEPRDGPRSQGNEQESPSLDESDVESQEVRAETESSSFEESQQDDQPRYETEDETWLGQEGLEVSSSSSEEESDTADVSASREKDTDTSGPAGEVAAEMPPPSRVESPGQESQSSLSSQQEPLPAEDVTRDRHPEPEVNVFRAPEVPREFLETSGIWEYCELRPEQEPVEDGDEAETGRSEPLQAVSRDSYPDVATLLIDHINHGKMVEFNGYPTLWVSSELSCVSCVIFSGVVKSVAKYERRTVIVVEDGTGSIECIMYPDEEGAPTVDLDATVASVGNADVNDSFLGGSEAGDTLDEDMVAFIKEMDVTSVRLIPRVGAIVMVHGRVTARRLNKAVTVEAIYEAPENTVLTHISMMMHAYPLYGMRFPDFLQVDDFQRLFQAKDEAELAVVESDLRTLYQGSTSDSFMEMVLES